MSVSEATATATASSTTGEAPPETALDASLRVARPAWEEFFYALRHAIQSRQFATLVLQIRAEQGRIVMANAKSDASWRFAKPEGDE